jgi:hypothetical protein
MVHDSRPISWQPQSSWLDAAEDDRVASIQERPPGHPTRSALAGAAFGAVGGWVALGVAQGLEDRARLVEHARVALGYTSFAVSASPRVVWLVVAFAAVLGMLLGAGLGWLMRRLHGLPARVVFAAVLVPSVWIAVDAFGLVRFAPHLAEHIPFVPWLLGAAVYGVCAALALPVVPRSAPSRKPRLELLDDLPTSRRQNPGVTDSFLLLRRKA